MGCSFTGGHYLLITSASYLSTCHRFISHFPNHIPITITTSYCIPQATLDSKEGPSQSQTLSHSTDHSLLLRGAITDPFITFHRPLSTLRRDHQGSPFITFHRPLSSTHHSRNYHPLMYSTGHHYTTLTHDTV